METIMAPIEMIAKFTVNGRPRPVKFRIEDGDALQEVRVDTIVAQSEEKIAGNRMLIYSCKSAVKGAVRAYELKYEITTCRWFLSRA